MIRLALFAMILLSSGLNAGEITDISHLTGDFNPAKDPDFMSLKDCGIPFKNGPHYLRSEAAQALLEMINDFSKEHPKIQFWIQSSTRNFAAQKVIWNAKWRGERNSNGFNATKEKDPVKRARLILEYSSMPGTSRHHWGTDFDINELQNDYYNHGDGKILFDWLEKNAVKYGFARPYTADRTKGYKEEKWHWSYITLSKKYIHEWLDFYENNSSYFTKKGLFDGSESAGTLAKEYVESVNPECK
jgi:zinc D-Ala-D-Ala carboxypeptidase